MAKINLLPWREARREQLKQEFLGNLGSVSYTHLTLQTT